MTPVAGGTTRPARPPAAVSTTPRSAHPALGPVDGMDTVEQALFLDTAAFRPLGAPKKNWWRARVDEPSQSFPEYVVSEPNRVDDRRRTLYLCPLGVFPTEMVVSRESVVLVRSPPLDWLADYVERFYGLKTRVLSALDIDAFELPTRMRGSHRQYDAPALLAALSTRLPADAYAMVALINRDLFIHEAQHYAFGYGLHRDRLAVMSFGRLDPIFDGLPRPPTWQADTARRSLTVLAHEVGHTFGMRHCSFYACVLNGMSHLKEVDATPPHLCPVCLRKLVSLGIVDPVERYQRLASFYADAQMAEPHAWVRARLDRVHGPMAARG